MNIAVQKYSSAALFYPDTTGDVGDFFKEQNAQTLVTFDYSTVLTGEAMVTTIDSFYLDIQTNPPLIISKANIGGANNSQLSFILSAGFGGVTYALSVTTSLSGTLKTDVLHVNVLIPDDDDACCSPAAVPLAAIQSGNQQAELENMRSGGIYGSGFIRYYVSPTDPIGPKLMDYWYDTANEDTYIYVTDGVTSYWQPVTGVPGPAGPVGFPGPPGAPGTAGPPGPPGPTFPDAPADNQYYVRWNNSWQLENAGGSTVTISDTPPIGPTLGNLWYDSVGGQMYVWYSDGTSSQWVVVVNRAGATGLQGPPGPQGAPGAASTVPGPQGNTGPQGQQGDPGPIGPASTVPGPAGPTGPLGPPGPTGAPGPSGYTLPIATTTTLGGIRPDGTTITINSSTGVISSAGGGSFLPISGGTLTGGIVVQGPADLKVQTVTQSGANLAINRTLGENCALSLTASITAVTVSNWPAAGTTGKVRLTIANTGAFTMAGWPTGTIWPGGTAPTITSGASKKDIILLMSDDGGVTIYGSIVGQDYR